MEFVNSNELHNCCISDSNSLSKEKFYLVNYDTNDETNKVNSFYFLHIFCLNKIYLPKTNCFSYFESSQNCSTLTILN